MASVVPRPPSFIQGGGTLRSGPMSRLVECVPNFSEGRDPVRVARIADAARAVPGAAVLDVERDADHHRMVLTLAGDPEAVLEAAFRAAAVAVREIDLNAHRGQHPRMGAMDVCPFVPVSGVTMADCVALAKRLGERLGRELALPVFLYAEAASRPDRVRLPDIRKGEFEGLRERIGTDPDRAPDFGPARIHPTAGCTAVGARSFLIAFNVNLETADVEAAKAIAKLLRESDGGLPGVQAKGFAIEDGRAAQVSMNLLDYRKTSPGRAFAAVETEARRRGISVRGSEIVGLVPEAALLASAADLMRPAAFSPEQVFEVRLRRTLGEMPSLDGFLEDLASPRPTPGGGSAAALAGALGAALAGMVGGLTAGKKGYEAQDAAMRTLVGEAAGLRLRLRRLMDEDSAAFDQVSAAMKLPKASDAEKAVRQAALQKALMAASESPLETMRVCLSVLALADAAAEHGNVHAVSDAAVGALAARAGLEGAAYNVLINAGSIKDAAAAARLREEAAALRARGRDLEARVLGRVDARLKA